MTLGNKKIKPHMMTFLVRRLESIAREMTNTTIKSARSGIMSTARDFSCSILTGDGRILFLSEGIPVHMANSDLVIQSLLEHFGDDIYEGDCFLNNSPYHGNTHHADFTYIAPVFYEEELMFFVMNRGHQADIGNHSPTTYYSQARNLYEEGALNFPNVRVQKNYKDVKDVIRMSKMRIRVPEQWYGDYLAQLGSCRVAEKKLKELCQTYGKDYIKTFIEQYIDYGEKCIVSAIKKLPKANLKYSTVHDPIPNIPDEEASKIGIPLTLEMEIDPSKGYIYVDVSKNRSSLEGGLNLSKATTKAAVVQGILGVIAPNLPHNHGAFKRIKIKMEKNKIVGESEHPISMSMATTNIADRVANMSGAIFEGLGERWGIAEHGYGMTYGHAVISGKDPRRNGKPYVNQLLNSAAGGGAVYGYDGWLTTNIPVASGIMSIDSVEISEQKYPILIKSRTIRKDSQGFGKWCGAPGRTIELLQRFEEGSWVANSDGHFNPPKGIHGGLPGKSSNMYIRKINGMSKMWELGEKVEIPQFGQVMLKPDVEVLISEANGGGGFGDPLERDPEKVRKDAREGWISLKVARNVFGVVLNTDSETYEVDIQQTKELRAKLLEQRKK